MKFKRVRVNGYTHHVTSEKGWATTTTILWLATVDDVLNQGEEVQAWIRFWDTIHASEGTMTAMKEQFPHVVLCIIPPHSTSYLQHQDAGPLRLRRLVRRRRHEQDMAATVFGRMGSSRSHGPLRQNQAWTTGWRRLRAHSDDEFREAVTEAAALHARDGLFAC